MDGTINYIDEILLWAKNFMTWCCARYSGKRTTSWDCFHPKTSFKQFRSKNWLTDLITYSHSDFVLSLTMTVFLLKRDCSSVFCRKTKNSRAWRKQWQLLQKTPLAGILIFVAHLTSELLLARTRKGSPHPRLSPHSVPIKNPSHARWLYTWKSGKDRPSDFPAVCSQASLSCTSMFWKNFFLYEIFVKI